MTAPWGRHHIVDLIRHHGRNHKRVFRCSEVAWTYAELPGIAARAAGRLAATGIAPGDRVAIMAPNSATFLETYLGCAWRGAIAVPINTAARGPQLAHILATAAPKLLITTADLLPHVDSPPEVWDITALPNAAPVPPSATEPGDPAAILFTSGTTGPSKGVICPHAQMVWWGIHTGRMLELTAADILGTTLPLFHTNALNTFYQALVHGASMVLEPRFSASGFWPAMQASRATVTYVLGAMVPILMAQPVSPAERQHRVRVALAPGVPAAMQSTFHERTGVAVVDGYGSTETNFVIGTTAANRRPDRMGPVAPGFHARVVDNNDTELPPDTPGELVLRTDEPHAFASGYWGMPEKTAEAWRNNWFHTGDRVVRDADSWFRFIDRMKEAIRRRGENISAWEVEQVLLSHPAIATAAVFPVPSDLAEDEVMAAIILREPATPEDIIAHCTPRLARYAIPRYIDIVDTLPMTENGKIRKFALTERGVTPSTWDREARK
jgi:crotonobetaine/carnitine-CoA ligase